MTDTPHFLLPFQFSGDQVPEVEEDSTQEILQCVFAVLSYVQGQRIDDPSFGLPDFAFNQGGVDLDELRSLIVKQEPRAEVLLESGQIDLLGMIELVNITVRDT